MDRTHHVRLLISCMLLLLGPAAMAGPSLRLDVSPPDAGADLSATPQPLYSGHLALTSSLPTLSPARPAAGRQNGTTGETAALRHSPLAGSLLTAPIAGSTDPAGVLRLRSFNAAAPGLSDSARGGRHAPYVRGASASLAPLPGRPERLTVVGASLYGPAAPNRYGQAGQQGPRLLGRTWAVTSDSLLLDSRLRVRGRYVRTDDGTGAAAGLGTGQAYDVGVAYLTPVGPRLDEGWHIELHHARIGAGLWTPRNPGLAKNVSLWQANASRRRGNFRLALACTRATENVDALDSALPTHLQTWESRLQYTPTHRVTGLGWLGRPVLAVHFRRQRWQAAGSAQDNIAGLDSVLTGGDLSMKFHPLAPLAWHLNTSWTTTADRVAGGQTFTHRYEVGMHLSPGAGIQLAPAYSVQSIQSQTDLSQTASGTVNARLPLLGGRAALHLNAEVDRFDPGQDLAESWQRTLNGHFVWHATRRHGNRPAIIVDLAGRHRWTSADVGAADWQVLASVRIRYGRDTD